MKPINLIRHEINTSFDAHCSEIENGFILKSVCGPPGHMAEKGVTLFDISDPCHLIFLPSHLGSADSVHLQRSRNLRLSLTALQK